MLVLYCAINCLVKIHLNIRLLFLFLIDLSMLFHILIKLCFGNFDENVVLGLCCCMLSCCIVMIVVVSLLATLGINCLKDVLNDPDCRSNINKEISNLEAVIFLIL